MSSLKIEWPKSDIKSASWNEYEEYSKNFETISVPFLKNRHDIRNESEAVKKMSENNSKLPETEKTDHPWSESLKTQPQKPNKRKKRKRPLQETFNFKPYNFDYVYPKKSCLSTSQHAEFVNLSIKFKSMLEDKLKPSVKDLTVYTFLKSKIVSEQNEFQNWLRNMAKRLCREEYGFVKQSARKFLRRKYDMLRSYVSLYPRFYEEIHHIPLKSDCEDQSFRLHLVQNLLEIGKMRDVILPSSFKQPRLPTYGTRLLTLRNSKRQNHPIISQDANAEKLAESQKVDIVLSSSALTCLIDNNVHKNYPRGWQICFTVRRMKNGKKTLFINKPLLPLTMSSREKNHAFHKESLKAFLLKYSDLSIRSKVDKKNLEKDKDINEKDKDGDIFENNYVSDEDIFGVGERIKYPTGCGRSKRGKRESKESQKSIEITDSSGDDSKDDSKTKSTSPLKASIKQDLTAGDKTSESSKGMCLRNRSITPRPQEPDAKAFKKRPSTKKQAEVKPKESPSSSNDDLTMDLFGDTSDNKGDEKFSNLDDKAKKNLFGESSEEDSISSPSKGMRLRNRSISGVSNESPKKQPVINPTTKDSQLLCSSQDSSPKMNESEGSSLKNLVVAEESSSDEWSESGDDGSDNEEVDVSSSFLYNSSTGNMGNYYSLETILKQQNEALSTKAETDLKETKVPEDPKSQEPPKTYTTKEIEDNFQKYKEDFVSYKLWKLGDLDLIVRNNVHGAFKGQNRHLTKLHIMPKLEYQSQFGFEQEGYSEMCRTWLASFLRNGATVLKANITPFYSRVLNWKPCNLQNWRPEQSYEPSFNPEKATTNLYKILKYLVDMVEEGHYLLHHDSAADYVKLLRSTDERGAYDLHEAHIPEQIAIDRPEIDWRPIDTTQILEQHVNGRRIPATFEPYDAKNQPKRRKTKKKHKKKYF
ncbi:DgyrCDS6691 [Dimorphilus gyrociliatus]|uniref:DgyrCDS6691 n=1 Tax=Dimorphilus gyrociliatus TaxID=2664684 RepID=A0A7I8VNT0_9ANNE|nr:DgyrCDS6691 [Dimorphilus gyrociliatus]